MGYPPGTDMLSIGSRRAVCCVPFSEEDALRGNVKKDKMIEITTDQFKRLYKNHFREKRESVMNLMPGATVKMRTGPWHLVSMKEYSETCEIGLAIHMRGGMTGGAISLQRLRLVMAERRIDWEIVDDYNNQTLGEIFDQRLIWDPESDRS